MNALIVVNGRFFAEEVRRKKDKRYRMGGGDSPKVGKEIKYLVVVISPLPYIDCLQPSNIYLFSCFPATQAWLASHKQYPYLTSSEMLLDFVCNNNCYDIELYRWGLLSCHTAAPSQKLKNSYFKINQKNYGCQSLITNEVLINSPIIKVARIYSK